MSEQFDPHYYTTPFALTKTIRRDPYPAILPSNPANSQKGKIILITGGGSGIGRAAALVWARASASGIVLAGRRLEKLQSVASEIQIINSETKVLSVSTDIGSEEDIKKLYAETKAVFGRVPDVVLLNAAVLGDLKPIGQTPVDDWWSQLTVNLKGPYSCIYHYINAQPNPSQPTGTIICVSSTIAGVVQPNQSAYGISKLAEQRLVEWVDAEHPTLRIFTTVPGIVDTDMVSLENPLKPFALDHADLTGMLALYLSQPRADYLKGCMVAVNWDVEEMEAKKEEILEKKLLRLSWLPVLPFCGGRGLN